MKPPVVSIIVPTYKDWDRLKLCLDALEDQSYPKEDFEIIVVNNAPHDIFPTSMRYPENCMLIDEPRPGSYAARNAALRICKGEIIGFTDSDCIPHRNWILNAVQFFEKNKKYTRLGGAINIFFKEEKPSRVELYDKFFAFPQEDYVNSGNAVTANMFTYRYLFDQVGFFDEDLLSGGDYYWGKLAEKAGFSIGYAPNVIVEHPARPSVRELLKKARRVGKGQAGFKKHANKGILKRMLEFIQIFKPRFWEVEKILDEKCNISLFNKFYLVVLRHFIIWTGDIARITTRTSKSTSL